MSRKVENLVADFLSDTEKKMDEKCGKIRQKILKVLRDYWDDLSPLWFQKTNN